MLGGSVVEVVVGRPEGEVGVVDEQGYTGQAECYLLVRHKVVGVLCL